MNEPVFKRLVSRKRHLSRSHPPKSDPAFSPSLHTPNSRLNSFYSAQPKFSLFPFFQAKHAVGRVGDRYEREADHIAETVSSASAKTFPRDTNPRNKPTADIDKPRCFSDTPLLRLQPSDTLQQTPHQPHTAATSVDRHIRSLPGRGKAIPDDVRHTIETGFHSSDSNTETTPARGPFEHIRIHTNDRSARAAKDVNARAFTTGNHIVFGEGQFQPRTQSGLRLLTHELVHTMQQQSLSEPMIQKEDDEEEKKEPPPVDFDRKSLLWQVYLDLFGPNFIGFSKGRAQQWDPSLKLKGTEFTSLYAPMMAWIPPLMNNELGRYPNFDDDDFKAYEQYLKTMGQLSPSGSDDLVSSGIDLLSLAGGVRIDDYFGSDVFLKHRLWPYLNAEWGLFRTLGWLGLAQGLYSGGVALSQLGDEDEEKDPNEFGTPNWLTHLGMLKFLAFDAPTKAALFKTPSVFGGLTPYTADAYKASTYSHFTGLSFPSPKLEYEESAEGGGKKFSSALPLNLASLFTIGNEDAPGMSEMLDLSKYRGPQLTLFGDYKYHLPTEQQLAEGGRLSQYAKGGILGGYGGHTGLFEGGASFDNDAIQSYYFRGGYNYTFPKDSILSQIGLSGTYFNWSDTAQEAKGFGGETSSPVGGWAVGLTPFITFGNLLGSKQHNLSLDAAATLAFGSVDNAQLAFARMGLSYKKIARNEKGELDPKLMPEWSIGGGFSMARPQWWNPEMPHMYGAQVKGNYGPFFLGTQFHYGDSALTSSQATALGFKEEQRKAFELFLNLGWNFDVYGQSRE